MEILAGSGPPGADRSEYLALESGAYTFWVHRSLNPEGLKKILLEPAETGSDLPDREIRVRLIPQEASRE